MRVAALAERMGTACGGLEVYEASMLRALYEECQGGKSDVELLPILAYDNARALLPEGLRETSHMLWPRGKIGTAFGLGRCLRRVKPDLLHSFLVTPARKTSVPLLTNVYDLGFVRFPEHYPRALAWRLQKMLAWTVRRADMIVVISEATRRDLLELTKVDPDKVKVSHCALDTARFPPGDESRDAKLLERCGIRKPYLLYAGRLQPRKNIAKLIDAYDLLRDSNRFDGQLVLLGGNRAFLWEEPQARIDRSPYRKDIVQTGHVADDQVRFFYREALAFVFVSLYEGFGLPIVEAMASDIPVVCGNTTSLPEVAGGAALLVDPHDAEAIAEQLDRVVHDEALRNELVKKGRDRVNYFSWRKSARETIDIYRSML